MIEVRKSEFIFAKSLLAKDDKGDFRIINLSDCDKELKESPLEWLGENLIITEAGLDDFYDDLDNGLFMGDVHMVHTKWDYGAGGTEWDFEVDVKNLQRIEL